MARIYCLLLSLMLSTVSYAMVVDMRGAHIIEDSMAAAMHEPRPDSVSDALAFIAREYKSEDITGLNFKNNDIGQKGARAILEYALTLPHLKSLNLELNQINYNTGSLEYSSFEALLLQLLHKEEFEEIRLGGNDIASTAWYSLISQKLVDTDSGKIVWQLTD